MVIEFKQSYQMTTRRNQVVYRCPVCGKLEIVEERFDMVYTNPTCQEIHFSGSTIGYSAIMDRVKCD